MVVEKGFQKAQRTSEHLVLQAGGKKKPTQKTPKQKQNKNKKKSEKTASHILQEFSTLVCKPPL